MPQHIFDFNDGAASNMGQQQSHERIQPPSRADSLDERIAGLVSSNALPLAPPAAPSTLYNRLQARYNETRDLRRQLARELCHVNQQLADFQHVPRGRRLFLRVQHNAYSQRAAELEIRIHIFEDFLSQNPGIHPDDVMDSSDDEEEEFFGREPPPMLDYGSDDGNGPENVTCHVGEGEDALTITLSIDVVEAYGENLVGQRRVRRARLARRRRHRQDGWQDAGRMLADEALPAYDDIFGGVLQNMRPLVPSLPSGIDFQQVLETGNAVSNMIEQVDSEEYASDFDEDFDEEEEEEEEDDDGVGADEPDYMPNLDTQEDGIFEEASENNVGVASDPDRPDNWQPFHQYFMYSCRGDITAVTSELQATFHFEPEVRRTWVGAQLNEIGNIRKQLEYLEGSLAGEIGTIDRAHARQQMASLDFFVQDIYDGINIGQIFDIDPTSDAYTEPVRPADLPPTWTSVLDLNLLTVLPDSPSMETFWLGHASILQEMWEDGIGSVRKEGAMNMRCGQLRYLKLSEEELAGGRQVEQERRAVIEHADLWSADEPDTEMTEGTAVGR